jgi:Zn-finger nucleic acid-binding protein
MDCPHDKCAMNPFRHGKWPRWECPMCSGMFIAERDVMDTLGYKDDRRFEHVAKVKVANVKDSKIPCPQDGTTLKAVKYLNTELDICPQCHAMWLDYGEFEKIFRRLDDQVVKMRGERQHKVVVEEVDAPVAGNDAEDVFDFLSGALDWAFIWKRIL